MATLADIKKASGRKKPFLFSGSIVPAGHFGATITLDGKMTVYLLEGTEGDKDAFIKGRVVLVPDENMNNPSTLAVYKGDTLRGGEFVGNGSAGNQFDENFLRIL